MRGGDEREDGSQQACVLGRERDLPCLGPADEHEGKASGLIVQGEGDEGAEALFAVAPFGHVGGGFRVAGAVNDDVFPAAQADAEDGLFVEAYGAVTTEKPEEGALAVGGDEIAQVGLDGEEDGFGGTKAGLDALHGLLADARVVDGGLCEAVGELREAVLPDLRAADDGLEWRGRGLCEVGRGGRGRRDAQGGGFVRGRRHGGG